MKLIYFFIFFYFNIFSCQLLANKISIVDIQFIIDNNLVYINTLNEIEINQEKHLKNFQIKENELKKISEDIENSKILLSEDEINMQISNYNQKLSNFSMVIEEFNYHYQNEIIKIREAVLKEIIKLLEKYAIENNVDLILDSTSYLIASNSLDITETISEKLNKINFKLEYKNFEKN